MKELLQEKMVLVSNKSINNIKNTENNILEDTINEINQIKNETELENNELENNEIENIENNEIENNEIENNENNKIENIDLQICYKNIENKGLLSNISKDFNYIKFLVDETNDFLNLINNKIDILKKNHSNFLQESKVSDNITLDSFLFQSSILDESLIDRKNIFSRIQNKIYSDYYKLYKNISNFYLKIIKDNETTYKENNILNNEYIPYNDLDKHFVYDFDSIIKLNKDILSIINYIIELIKKKSKYIKQKEKNLSLGYDVDFLVNYENYNKLYLINSLNLYINNININNCLHYKHLLSFYSQLKYFYLLIVKHISFDDENIYSNFYNYQDKIDHNLIDSIVNIDNNIIDITSHLYKKTNNVSIQTESIIYDEQNDKKEHIISTQTDSIIYNEQNDKKEDNVSTQTDSIIYIEQNDKKEENNDSMQPELIIYNENTNTQENDVDLIDYNKNKFLSKILVCNIL
jgi:hypothetical protein